MTSLSLSNAKWYLWSQRLSHLRHVEQIALAGGGQRAVERQVLRLRKLTVQRRIKCLLDPADTFLEFSKCAGYNLPSVGTIPNAGVVTGIGKIASQDTVIIAHDSTVKAGATYPISLKKAIRAARIAISNQLPIVSLVDSAGAFLPLQSEIFPDANHGGRSFYYQARHRAPQLSVILGHCTAGGAYTPIMTDQTVIVERQGAVFLGGPPLVKAALGTVLSAEELGGAKLHTKESGCTDYRSVNEVEAIKMIREIFVQAVPKQSKENVARKYEEPLKSLEDIEILVNKDSFHFNANSILDGLLDGSSYHNYKPEFGLAVGTAFGSIQGYTVGIAITTDIKALATDPDSLAKLAHFVQICCSRDTPLIMVSNSSPRTSKDWDSISPLSIAATARLLNVLSTSPIPRISLLIGDNRSSDVFFSLGLQPDFVFAWPTVKHYTVFTEQSESGNENDNSAFKDAIYGSARIWDDGIIVPGESRKVLGRILSIIATRSERSSLYSKMFWPHPPLKHFANITE